MAKRITEGPYKGYFTLPDELLRENESGNVGESLNEWKQLETELRGSDLVWYRYSPGPNRKVYNKGAVRQLDDFYYVRHNKEVDLRKLLYALETKRVPSTGNMEVFNLDFKKINVPSDWCPYLIDPCYEDWCESCLNKSTEPQPMEFQPISFGTRWMILMAFSLVIGFIIAQALLS